MRKTKLQHITNAYKWLTISGITSNPSPNELVDGLEMLEDMMHELQSRNICSSYVFEDMPDPNTDSGIDSAFNTATATNLALRLANYFGKEALPTLQRQASQSMSNWSARTGKVNQITPPNRQPRGSGSTFRFPRWVRYYRFEDNAPIECDTFRLKVGQKDTYSVDFTNYLFEGATIDSYTVESDDRINVDAHNEVNGVINLECTGVKSGYSVVTITVTTSNGRINPQQVNFNITD